jgi:DNA-binding CsgD family transcriptional regulator
MQSSLPCEIPTFARFAGDLVEALSAAGRRDEAAEVLARCESMKAARWSRWLNGVVLRGHGLVDNDDQAAMFDQSLQTLAPWDSWESARTRLCYGRHLRRSKQRREASEHLQAALSAFERLGARGWAAQARQELRSSGVRANIENWRPTGLTPQELRVSLAVAGGGTNREVAAALFMSPKTVEHHLGRAFAKLGVTSRTQLARMVEAGELDSITA